VEPKVLLFTLFAALVLYNLALAQASTPHIQQSLVLSDEQGEYPTENHMDILEDAGGELTIN
jgi:hypothetical protein